MKVVMLKDVKGTGKAHMAVEVKDGHALNFLIPRKLAVPASPSALKQAEVRMVAVKQQKEMENKLIENRLAALADEKIVFKKKANEKGHLYDALDAEEIATIAVLPHDSVRIERPFKELGTFDVPVAYGETFGKITVEIVAE